MHYYTYKTFHFKLLIYNDPYTCINSIIKWVFFIVCALGLDTYISVWVYPVILDSSQSATLHGYLH